MGRGADISTLLTTVHTGNVMNIIRVVEAKAMILQQDGAGEEED